MTTTMPPSSPAAPEPEAVRALADGPATVERRARQKRRRAIAKQVRRALLVAFGIGAIAAMVLAFRPKPVLVDVAVVARGPLVVAVEETGATRVKDRYLVSASVMGTMSRLALEPGDAVKEGDALVTIAPVTSPMLDERTRVEAEARLSMALAALGQARAQAERMSSARALSSQELDRTRSLATAGSVPRQTLEEAEFQDRMRGEELRSATFAVKVAGEEVRRARAVLGRESAPGTAAHGRSFDVLAPASGTVLRVHQKSASVVQPGSPILELGDDTLLEVVVDLLTTDAVHVRVGSTVAIQGWGGERPFQGRVRRIEPSGFTKLSALGVDEQRVNVIVAIVDPPGEQQALRDGYRVEARFVLWRSDDVLEVPNGAVFRHGDHWAVYRIVRGRARLTRVTIGHRGEGDVEILEGVAAGDAIVVHPGDRVKDDARVTARASER